MGLLTANHPTEIFIDRHPRHPDPKAEKILSSCRHYLNLDVSGVKILRAYRIYKPLNDEMAETITSNLLIDPVIEQIATEESFLGYDWRIEVSFKPGVTDNAGKTAQITMEDFLGVPFEKDERVCSVIVTLVQGRINEEDALRIARELLANSLIEAIRVIPIQQTIPDVSLIDLNGTDDDLISLSRRRQLALNLAEMKAIRDYYRSADVIARREEAGLPPLPTDVELEALAQTWSEHCKHKIFQATINYTENGRTTSIRSLFSTYIKRVTEELKEARPWLVSVFSDNAGIIRFTDRYHLAFKVETHNSPSALDPYGGALTGILGVNRDIMGAGVGARLVANTNVLCFAPPETKGPIPKKLLHPKRVFEGVRQGIEHGGNKSGVPTVNGSIVFDDCFLGKPLVYCGTVGIMPAYIEGRATHIKEIHPGDRIIIAGGRTGKDGIHGATFSSEELHAKSPSSAVQIGDPFTQKKLHDFLMEARDQGLYRTITDNGAGGFSSSVGELAELSGGCEIHLDRALLKQSDCLPWEILISESQERMTLAVDPDRLDSLQKLAKIHEIELCDLGTFTDSGHFHVLSRGATVAYLDLDFLHRGLPPMQLEAEWSDSEVTPLELPHHDATDLLHRLLSRPNICSKEWVVRQYDHEVQGGSALKPMVGAQDDGPSDAAVIRPLEVLDEAVGFAVSNGLCPRYHDGYHMAANAVDEAVRNIVSVGANPATIALLDNFCWPDPIYDPVKTPDGKVKCAHLVRANQALYDLCKAYKTPLISGKDSMKNDYKVGNIKISIKPTLLISAIAAVPDVMKVVSMDFKLPGDAVYILGTTKNELRQSELCEMLGLEGGEFPKVIPEKSWPLYEALYKAIDQELIASCHDCSDGGIAVALAECAFSGELGVVADLKQVPREGSLTDLEILFSESPSRFIVSVSPDQCARFEELLNGLAIAKIGRTSENKEMMIKGVDDKAVIRDDIRQLKASWQKPLENGI